MEELDLREIFMVFWNKRVHILLIVLMFAIIGAVYSYKIVVWKYKASTTLVLATTENESSTASASITQTEITINQKLVSTYSELIKSKTVLRQVINNLNILLDEEELRKNITVTAVSNTELIQITVVNENKEYPSIIANEIATVFTEQVKEIYNISNVHIVDEAEAPQNPYNINHIKNIVIFTFIGLVIAAAYVLIYNMIDNTIKTSEDVEKNAGLLVLAEIPEYCFDLKKRRA